MQLVVYSKSSSFERHLKTVFSCPMEFRQRLVTPDNDSTAIYLVHAASFQDELIDWLRHRPLLHHDTELGFTLVHAGFPPQWDLELASACARELELALRGPRYADYFTHMYGDTPSIWSEVLTGWDRLRYITNALTRIRYCHEDGTLAMELKAAPGTQPLGYLPWYAARNRARASERIIFGHWSTLELRQRVDPSWGVIPLDNGCIWGGHLTAFALQARRYVDMPCRGWRQPAELRNHAVALRG